MSKYAEMELAFELWVIVEAITEAQQGNVRAQHACDEAGIEWRVLA